MLTWLIIALIVVLAAALLSRMARSSWRARDDEQRRLEELLRSDDAGGEGSPPAPFPFGGMLDELMRGMETRSYRVDPATGEWVEMTDERPAEREPTAQPPRAKRKPRTRPQRTASLSAFGLNDGSGE